MREAFRRMSREDRRQFLEAMRFEGSIHSSDLATTTRAPSMSSVVYEPYAAESPRAAATAALPVAIPAAPLVIMPPAVGEVHLEPVQPPAVPMMSSAEALLPTTVGGTQAEFVTRLQVRSRILSTLY